MILLRDLGFSRNGDPLVTGASLQLHPGWKVGLTGANGCGKSSFLALLRGELHADRGDLERPPGWVLAHVAQDTPALPDAALDFVLDGDTELRQIGQRRRVLGDVGQHPAGRPFEVAAVGMQLAAQQGEKGRLAAAIGAGESDLPAGMKLK